MSSVWWVNQGITYNRAVPGGYLWAPSEASNGRPMSHWETMREVQPGDTVIHYANSNVRALSTVTAAATQTTQPDPTLGSVWADNGYLVRVAPVVLDQHVPLDQLPGRVPDAGPFDRNGEPARV